MAEIVTSPVSSGIINLKMAQLLSRREKSLTQIQMFQNTHLEDARAIREAINSGERTFEEFFELLEKAARFKEWLKGRNPDANLLRDFYRAATTDTWLERLPTRSVRFVLATLGGLGADLLFPTGGIGTGIGVGLGAIDSLALDRIMKGWRPNHFIEGELSDFASRR
jgi:hypothetical protein